MAARPSSSLLLATGLLITVLVVFTNEVEGQQSQCTKRNVFGNTEMLSCPPMFERKKAYCCGNEQNRYCCKWSKAKEHGMRGNNVQSGVSGKNIVKGIGVFFLIILLVVVGCIGLCCYCVYAMLRGKRTNRGQVLGNPTEAGGLIGGQSVHVVNQPGADGSYPSQPSGGSAYPSQPGGAAYPTIPQGGGYPPQAGYPQPGAGGPAPYPQAQMAPSGGYPGYPPIQQAGYQTSPAPSYPPTYPSSNQYPMGNMASDSAPPYPTGGDKPPPFNPGYPQ